MSIKVKYIKTVLAQGIGRLSSTVVSLIVFMLLLFLFMLLHHFSVPKLQESTAPQPVTFQK